jgi:hypothetical protein
LLVKRVVQLREALERIAVVCATWDKTGPAVRAH